jgi:DNA-binding NarL/FixJ family response regulator
MNQYPGIKKDKKRFFVIDAHPIVCMGLTHLINRGEDLMVFGEAHNYHEALENLDALQPDIAIIDIFLRGQSCIELIKNIKARCPKFPILVFSVHEEFLYAEIALRAGAKGYIMKHETSEKIIIAIRQVLNGDLYVSHDTASNMLYKYLDGRYAIHGSPLELLSDRELEVLQLVG